MIRHSKPDASFGFATIANRLNLGFMKNTLKLENNTKNVVVTACGFHSKLMYCLSELPHNVCDASGFSQLSSSYISEAHCKS